jgi:hypothetical protein
MAASIRAGGVGTKGNVFVLEHEILTFPWLSRSGPLEKQSLGFNTAAGLEDSRVECLPSTCEAWVPFPALYK